MPGHLRQCTREVLSAATLIMLVVPLHLDAQLRGRVSGTVSDALSLDPIVDATVSVLGTTLATGTDEEGRFVFDSVAPGLVKLKAQILGYYPITTDYYTVLPDTTTNVDFRLAPLAYELDPVEVTATNPTRRWRHVQGAQVLTKEQLPQQGNILHSLQGLVPGVRVTGRREDTRLVVRGAEADVLYVVDGTVIRPPLTFHIDAADVDCVEIRRGFRAVIEYKPSIVGANYAGVVLIWTKGAIGPRPQQCMPGNP